MSQHANLHRYKHWFLAAAIYNALFGAFASLFPNTIFDWLGIVRPNYPQLFQCIGMIVGVYALGYWLVWRDPLRYGAFVYLGLLGKVLGPIGFVVSALRGELPWSFGWLNVFNDLIWLPAFFGFAVAWGKTEPRV